jgi:hypothetical protein
MGLHIETDRSIDLEPNRVRLWNVWTLSIILFYSKLNISETGACLRLLVVPTELGPFDVCGHLHQQSEPYAHAHRCPRTALRLL